MIGPHVYGDNRRGLWVQESTNLTDKLAHYLPRLRGAIPNLTDVFLPPTAAWSHRDQVRAAGFFSHTWAANHGRSAVALADYALAAHKAQKAGALELNIEGILDSNLASYVVTAVIRVRASKPLLPLRINVVPFKGAYLPIPYIADDPNLYVIAQCYGGNMEALYAADEVLADLTDYGLPAEKCSVMHAVMCEGPQGGARQVVLPQIRNRGSFYIDDLLLDAGLLV